MNSPLAYLTDDELIKTMRSNGTETERYLAYRLDKRIQTSLDIERLKYYHYRLENVTQKPDVIEFILVELAGLIGDLENAMDG